MKDVRKSRKTQTKTDAWAVEVTLKNFIHAGDFQVNRNWTDILILHHNITNITL